MLRADVYLSCYIRHNIYNLKTYETQTIQLYLPVGI